MNYIIYDGDCGICSYSADWLSKRLDPDLFIIIPFDEELEISKKFGLNLELALKTVIFIESDKFYTESRAVFEIANHLSYPYKFLGIFLANKFCEILFKPIYRLIARYRTSISRIFGLKACKIRYNFSD